MSLTINHLKVTTDRASEYERLATVWGSHPAEVAGSIHVLVGGGQSMVDQLEERREVYGLSYVIVSAAALDDFGPVVETLAGT